MLVFDFKVIGNKLYEIRSKKIMSRAEVAEKADISDRTYADVECGSTNMRIETLLKICEALSITPNDILVTQTTISLSEKDLASALNTRSNNEKETALNLLSVYIDSLK